MRDDPALADHHRSYPDGPPVVRVDTPTPPSSRPPPANWRHWRCTSRLATWPRCGPHSPSCTGVTASRSPTPSWRPRPIIWRCWSAATDSSRTWPPACTPTASCWRWPARWTTTALGCGGRPPAAWLTTARRRWCTCAGGWRRSSAPSYAATPSSCDAKPSSARGCVTWVWSGGGGAAGGPPSWRASWPTAGERRERSARRLGLLGAKLQVIDNTEQARAAWIRQAREVLVRGVAAAQVLVEREQHHRLQQPDDGHWAGTES